MVTMGLMVGNRGRALAMSDKTRHYVDLFWELIDEILNAVLFVLLGLEIILLSLSWRLFGLSVAVIAITTFDFACYGGAVIKALFQYFNAPADTLRQLSQRLPDSLLFNAGSSDDGLRREQWQRVIDVNLNGFFNVTQPLSMPMIRTRWGRIVNISSVATAGVNRVPYSATDLNPARPRMSDSVSV